MSRQPRAGTAGKPVTFRATEPELATWERAAESEDCDSLSAWIVKTLNRRAGYDPDVSRSSPPARSSSGKKARSRR